MNWKTTLGGILGAAGVALSNTESPIIRGIGQVLMGIGLILTGVAAADANKAGTAK